MLHRTGNYRANVILCRPGKGGRSEAGPGDATRIRGALSELGKRDQESVPRSLTSGESFYGSGIRTFSITFLNIWSCRGIATSIPLYRTVVHVQNGARPPAPGTW